MASEVYRVCAFCDFTRAARTFPSANPTMIGPSAGQIRQVTAELCLNLLQITFLSPLKSFPILYQYLIQVYLFLDEGQLPIFPYFVHVYNAIGLANRDLRGFRREGYSLYHVALFAKL